jgi:phosphatidylserine/phosphatidylglycerophosphate/cardiolipin synthase-like enzyme
MRSRGVGCAVDSRERTHQKIVIIDGRIVWNGSLNALSYGQRSEELMTRLVNTELARMMAAILAKRRVHFTKALERIADP